MTCSKKTSAQARGVCEGSGVNTCGRKGSLGSAPTTNHETKKNGLGVGGRPAGADPSHVQGKKEPPLGGTREGGKSTSAEGATRGEEKSVKPGGLGLLPTLARPP